MTPEQQNEAVMLLIACRNHCPSSLYKAITDLLKAIDGVTSEPPRPTVRVRAAVAVVDGGAAWSVYGDGGFTDAGLAEVDFRNLRTIRTSSTYFIEADIPLPQPETIQAEVV